MEKTKTESCGNRARGFKIVDATLGIL